MIDLPIDAQIIILPIFIACYALALSRKVKLAYASVGALIALIVIGLISWQDTLFVAIQWDVLAVIWGFMMVSFIFSESKMPELIANKILTHIKIEKYALLAICAVAAFLSAFMANVAVLFLMAPVAIQMAKKLGSPLFPYIVSVGVSANMVTTTTMIADPPALILAIQTGMSPLDFYWFQGRVGLGAITVVGVMAAMLTLLLIFRKMNKRIEIEPEEIKVSKLPTILFLVGIVILALAPEIHLSLGVVGLAVGIVALLIGRKDAKRMIVEFDWNSLIFLAGIFAVIYTLSTSGLLTDFAQGIINAGVSNPSMLLAVVVWMSVGLSSFIDPNAYTVLMIPVCQQLATFSGMSAWPLLFGTLVGTGSGANILPMGAATNVFACGLLEKNNCLVSTKEYIKIGLPLSVVAVATANVLLWIFWL
ncbi:MAG: SLC13 family permease [Candidatus Bathyarchaeota archaeon]|nr:SLC13 family permease [Candidatus Bathyarchaeota archaeon]